MVYQNSIWFKVVRSNFNLPNFILTCFNLIYSKIYYFDLCQVNLVQTYFFKLIQSNIFNSIYFIQVDSILTNLNAINLTKFFYWIEINIIEFILIHFNAIWYNIVQFNQVKFYLIRYNLILFYSTFFNYNLLCFF